MKREEFCQILGDVDARYVKEARTGRGKAPVWRRRGAAAACLAAVFLTALAALPSPLGRQGAAPPERPGGAIAGPSAEDGSGDPGSAASGISVSMGAVSFNALAAEMDAGLWYDPALYDCVHWDREAVAAYYGKDLTPAYVPSGLLPAPGSGTASVVMDKSGGIAADTVWLGFYHDYYEDGSPKLSEDAAAPRGFSMTVSKTGLLSDCLYLLPEDEVTPSDLGGTAVTFGYRSMPYGPYDPDTHAPSGYYDLYVAEFTLDGAEYQIVAKQLEADEVVKVVASILWGEEVAVGP